MVLRDVREEAGVQACNACEIREEEGGRMSETGFVCPKCGNTTDFYADVVVETVWGCRITPEGWDDAVGDGCDVDFAEFTTLRCCKCGYEGHHSEFEEE